MSTRRPHRRLRGFTLIELVVVIGIIVLLTGLSVFAGSSVVQMAERQRTQNTLLVLDMAMSEWEKAAERQLTWGRDGAPTPQARYDIQDTTPEIFIITQMLRVIGRVDSASTMLSRIETDFLYAYRPGITPPWIQNPQEQAALAHYTDGLTVLDAWGHPIYATHFGAVYDPAVASYYPTAYPAPLIVDLDGTTRIYNEQKYGVAMGRRICFVSAGPDGRFGHMYHEVGSVEHNATLDNLWSYPALEPEGAPVSAAPTGWEDGY